MLAGDFEPHFSVKHMLKDVRIAAKLAREFSLDLPVTEVSSDMLLAELKQGRGDADYSSVAQKYFSGPQKIVRPEPRKIEEPPKPAEPMFRMGEARPIATEAIAETKAARARRKRASTGYGRTCRRDRVAGARARDVRGSAHCSRTCSRNQAVSNQSRR